MVPLVVESGSTQREDCGGLIDEGAIIESLDEGFVSRLLHQPGDPVHRPVELDFLPLCAPGFPVQDPGGPVRISEQLIRGGAFGAEAAFVMRTPFIAFDVDDVVPYGVDDQRAADGAVGADARSGFGFLYPELLSACGGGDQRCSETCQ